MIANRFAEHFSKIGNLAFNKFKDSNISDRLDKYWGDLPLGMNISVEQVDDLISKMKRGKACGFDKLSVEHLLFSHPVSVSVVAKMFNIMLNLRYVPDNFGKGITVPIPKGECRNVSNKCDDYRGITINPVLSKLFEDCLLLRMQKYFETSSRQFGFKKGVGCRDAILNVKLASDHFTSNHSNVNICTIDVKKAFDSLNYNIIYNRLMDVHMPVCYIEILMCWYNKVFIVVKWQNVTSNFVKLKAGVR